MRSLLALVFLLSITTSVHAECAWVLWGETMLKSPSTPLTTEWRILSAGGGSERDCSARRSSWMQQTVSESGSGWSINGGAVQGKVGDIAVVVLPQCLPDTVDPRGPKGK
jgi:hypothetical protein